MVPHDAKRLKGLSQTAGTWSKREHLSLLQHATTTRDGDAWTTGRKRHGGIFGREWEAAVCASGL